MQSTLSPQSKIIARRLALASAFVIGATVLIGFFLAYRLSFVGDDWIFYEIAGRMNWQEYLIKYLDPGLQTAWYRPLQGVLFKLAYEFFGPDQTGYHVGNVLFHLANAWLLFAVVRRAQQSTRVALIAALLFASFPTAVEGIFKPGVVDPLTTTCFLGTLWFWLGYLSENKSRDYWLAWGCFVLALSSKEIAVLIPATLFLIDRCVTRAPLTFRSFMARYLWFGVLILGYLPIEYAVIGRSVFVRREGYVVGAGILSNLLDYAATLVFPWTLPVPFNYAALTVAALIFAYVILVKKMWAFLPIIASAIFSILPILAFPFVTYRFLYLSLTSTAIVYALALEWLARRLGQNPTARVIGLGAIVAVATVTGGAGITDAATSFAEFARVSRVPFRNVSQTHPSFPADTLLYFINPPLPGPSLSGMFFWRYGARAIVKVDDMSGVVGLRDHANTWVYVFTDQGEQKELTVEKNINLKISPALPASFSAPIRLENVELVSSTISTTQPLALILYWRASSSIDKNYTVSVHLIDPTGKRVAGNVQEPKRGKAPTSTWTSGDLIADAIQFPVTVPPGTYRLAIGLSDAATSEHLRVIDATGQDQGEQVILEPVSINQ